MQVLFVFQRQAASLIDLDFFLGLCVCCSVDVRKFYFSYRVLLPWNGLNVQPADFSSVWSFKHLLNSHGFSSFLHFT